MDPSVAAETVAPQQKLPVRLKEYENTVPAEMRKTAAVVREERLRSTPRRQTPLTTKAPPARPSPFPRFRAQCFVGKRRLEKAMRAAKERNPALEFEVRWHPFFLDPSLPPEGVDKMGMYKAKFGEARMAQMLPYMAAVGAADGITFDYGGRVANTLQSHRLIEFARGAGGAAAQDRLVEALFKAYFENQGNLGDTETLLAAAEAAGLDRGAAAAHLASDAGKDDVVRDVRAYASKFRISGVPFFALNDGKLKLSGAQEPATLLDAFEQLGA
jgi:predicted DsbA family dithiol-disulfide isomerase